MDRKKSMERRVVAVALAFITVILTTGNKAFASSGVFDKTILTGTKVYGDGKGKEEKTVLWEEQERKLTNSLHAKAAVLMDGESGRVLFSKNSNQELANASTTKILTCILLLETCDLTEVAQVSQRAAGQPKVRLGMRSGQTFYVKDLLYALMLESFNDCAVVLAEYAAGSVEDFAGLMNEKAKEIGCENSYFVTPNGLDDEDENGKHHTTAVDLANIMRYCLLESPKREEFLQITGASSYSFSEASGNGNYHCYNHNTLLTMVDGALSGKTGFTNDAGYCYVGAAQKEGCTLIVALLGCGWPPSKNYKWLDSVSLIGYGRENFKEKDLGEYVAELPDISLVGCRTEKLAVSRQGELITSVGEGERLFALCNLPGQLTGGIEAGDEVGRIDYYAGGEKVGSLPVLACGDTKALQYEDFLEKLGKTFLYGK